MKGWPESGALPANPFCQPTRIYWTQPGFIGPNPDLLDSTWVGANKSGLGPINGLAGIEGFASESLLPANPEQRTRPAQRFTALGKIAV